MVYGKVLEACTQHTVLKSYQKDFTPDFETLIKDARSFIMKELVGKLTGKSINIIGSKMAFYLLIKIFHFVNLRKYPLILQHNGFSSFASLNLQHLIHGSCLYALKRKL